MKHSFHPLAAVLLMCAGIGSGCAEEGGGGQRNSEPDHYSYIDAAFLLGDGFKSGSESYAAQREGAKVGFPENGAHFTSSEYLFLTGAAFYSGPEAYPFSW